MYAGSTFRPKSGHILGTHQKIDRVAHRHLRQLTGLEEFPPIKMILGFEGNNGPDAIKRKSPAQNEPWHYLQPFDESDTQLIELISNHYDRLTGALKAHDTVRAAFEAAWLSHAIVDGLTPAHHYPYEQKLMELSEGRSILERTTIAKKLVMPGDTLSRQIRNNWKMWGPKGLFVTHAGFENGIATLMAPSRLEAAMPAQEHVDDFNAKPIAVWYRDQAQAIARLELYTFYHQEGWTVQLAGRIRRELAPVLVRAVTLAWYGAAVEAGLFTEKPNLAAPKLRRRKAAR